MIQEVKTETRLELQIFADGSFAPGTRRGGWAFVVYEQDVEVARVSGSAANAANNTMELMAVLMALRWASENAAGRRASIWSDSHYVIEGANSRRHIWRTNGWKRSGGYVAGRNRTISDHALWKALDDELSAHPLTTVRWLKGHGSSKGNLLADELASRALLSSKARAT
jgi:ribonuclease HI